mgnify:CR=1 FL=1
MFAVKPQNITEVLEEMKPLDLSGKVVVSIMAGIPLAVLQKGLNGKGMMLYYSLYLAQDNDRLMSIYRCVWLLIIFLFCTSLQILNSCEQCPILP